MRSGCKIAYIYAISNVRFKPKSQRKARIYSILKPFLSVKRVSKVWAICSCSLNGGSGIVKFSTKSIFNRCCPAVPLKVFNA